MSEQTPEPTTASDLGPGGENKPGTDYGSPSAADEQNAGGSDPGGNGAAVPDDPSAQAAQAGVQEAFGVSPQD